MDWQQPVALGVVILTLGCFLGRALRRRRVGSGCDCLASGARRASGASDCGPAVRGLVVQGRKGERPMLRWR